jgi:hypothetical protein
VKKKLLINQSISGYALNGNPEEGAFSFAPGDITEVEDNLAQSWVASGIASWAPKEKPKAEFAVAKKSETPESPKVTTEDSK